MASVASWTAPWSAVPMAGRGGWAHPGLAITRSGQLVTCHPAHPVILVLDLAGRLVGEFEFDGREGHGITTTLDPSGQELLWIADPGFKLATVGASVAPVDERPGRVSAWDFSGAKIVELETPPLLLYTHASYKPTSVAVADGPGENGDLWVADGYGQSLVHHYSAAGDFINNLDGETGAGRFDGPHAITIVRGQAAEPELYVCDRENRRIQVFDLDGSYRRTVGVGELTSPSGVLAFGDRLIVAELRARLVVLERDRVVGTIGMDATAADRPGWPNRLNQAGDIVPLDDLHAERFNSPHAMATDGTGTLFVTEFMLGGRISKLRFRAEESQR